MVGLRFEDISDLVARGGIDGHMGFQHSLLPSVGRDAVDHQVQQLCVPPDGSFAVLVAVLVIIFALVLGRIVLPALCQS